MAIVVRENIAALTDKLTVKLTKEDYLPAFEKKLKEYSKTANIPGFRKGMVPIGMIKKMYGAGIFSDEVLRTIENELYTYLDTERPAIFAQPLPLEGEMSKLDMNNPSDFNFSFEIGLKSDVTLPNLATASVTKNIVDITDKMVSEEISRMQAKAGKNVEKEAVSHVDEELDVLFSECDENGIEIENGLTKDSSLFVKDFNQKLQEQLIGKKVGESIVCQLETAFDGDILKEVLTDIGSDKEDAETSKKYFKIEITKISVTEASELDEEFYNIVYPGKEIKTEAELRTAMHEELEKYWASQTANQLHDQIYHLLMDEAKVEFPKEFLTRWLKTGGDKQRSQEEAEAEYPAFQNQLKWTLINDKIITENKLEVSEADMRQSMKDEISRYFGQMNLGQDMSWLESYIDRMMKDEKQVDATYRRLITEKIFNWAASQTQPTDKKVTIDEFVKMQHNHQH